MDETFNMFSLGHYENYIVDNYVVDNLGIDISKLGRKTAESILAVDLDGQKLIDINSVRTEIFPVIKFIENFYAYSDERPVWHRINVMDQVLNEYIGIGFLSLEKDWLKFIINYLGNDRAEQSGDTIFSIFERNFKWALHLTSSKMIVS